MVEQRGLTIFGYLRQEKNGGWRGSFPDFDGIEFRGKNVSEVETKGYAVLNEQIEAIIAAGKKLPVFKKNFQVARDQKEEAKSGNPFTVLAFVFGNPAKPASIRFNIIATEAEVAKIDKAATSQGLSRSRYLVEAGLERADKISKNKSRA
ncbi:MAG: type II toxin-antitoxin system HicB family antitoxin [Alphaproteobacteria bacterium]|nr:type II toxin-antitoxin system HicB family antitoxin [Alphaproteobacteria bacterium]